jgi:1,4-dihydroxy-2-naphthoate octaprenyltransferase
LLQLEAVRPAMLAASLVPVLVGAALAARDGFLHAELLALTAAGVLLFHAGANLANDYFDHRARIDERNLTPTRFAGGSRAIQRGALRPRTVLALALLAYAAGAAVGLDIAWQLQAATGNGLAEILVLGLSGFLVGLLFSAPPARLAHRGLGELAIGLGLGPLVLAGTYLVQRAAAGAGAWVSPEAWLLSVPVGAFVAAVLFINEFPSQPWDARAGKRTLVVRLSPRRAVQGYAALLALAYASIAAAALALQAWPLLLALLTAPLAARAWRALGRDHDKPWRLAPANAMTLVLHLATGALLAGGLLLGTVRT